MAEERETKTKSAHKESAHHGEETKEDLQRRMDDTRSSISQTMTEIKDTVVDQYEAAKESVAETLDWREQFRKNPVAWCFGAISVGYVVGNSIAGSMKETKTKNDLLSHLGALGDRFTDELSQRGMNILVPALTGTVLVPVLTGKIKELTGIDLSDLPAQLLGQETSPPQNRAGDKKRKKKNGKNGKNGKRGGKKQRDAARPDAT